MQAQPGVEGTSEHMGRPKLKARVPLWECEACGQALLGMQGKPGLDFDRMSHHS